MREYNENTITQAVLDRVALASNPRIGEISAALIRHLHAFIREIRPTEEEWGAGIAFLTATGQKCDANRQEFILLSDTLGVSTLVDSINHPVSEGLTETTVFGPFYVPAPDFELGENIAGTLEGLPMYISGSIRDIAGRPVAGAKVDVWHSDNEGFYDVQQLDKAGGLAGRGRLTADSQGNFHFWTRRPAAYPIPADGPVGEMLSAQGRHPWRPEHVHFMINAPGQRKLVTHIFAAGDQYLGSDVVFGVKESLIRPYVEHQPGTAPDGTEISGPWISLKSDFVLQPANAPLHPVV